MISNITNKRISVIILVLILFLLDSCSKQANDDVGLEFIRMPSVKYPGSNKISLMDIDLYLQAYKNIPKTKSEEIDVTPVVINQDTLFYLINYNKGWELLSADRRAPRRLVWAEDGNTSIEELYNNPASEAVFRTFVDGMSALRENQEWEPSDGYSENWDDLYLRDGTGAWELVSTTIEERDTIQNHLTTTRWGQDSPWNVCAPYMSSNLWVHCYTGCVPVAAAQTIYYLHDKWNLSIDTYENCYTNKYIQGNTGLVLYEDDVDFASYNHSDSLWAQMPLSASESSQFFVTVSTLMVRLGIDLAVTYQYEGTSGYISRIRNAFNSRYSINSSYTSNVNFDTVVNEIIEEQLPVILGISRFDNSGTRHGHAVVADAGRVITQITTKVYRKWIPPLDPEPIDLGEKGHDTGSYIYRTEVSEEKIAQYVGINWGYDGSFMYSGTSPIWYNTEAMSWTIGTRTYTVADNMLYSFEL